MPLTTAEALAAPIRRVQALVGPGWSTGPAPEPAAELNHIRDTLADVAASSGQAWRRVDVEWSGAGADAAADFAAATTVAIDEAAQRAAAVGRVAADAAGAVAAAHRRLADIVAAFEAEAAALEPRLDEPGVARELLSAAREALAEAIAVVEHLGDELERRATSLDHLPPASPGWTAPTAPAGHGDGTPAAGAPFAPAGSGVGPGGFASLGTGTGNLGGGSAIPAQLASLIGPEATDLPDSAEFGEGVAVRLPDGTVVMAPNAVAAAAVRHALTQLGVPYHWGGTTPGVGLDCSGLTQWAYGEAGLTIPRLAQEQDIGAAVGASSPLPGDLAVWDGHVAMVVGNGLMVEAGDPVKLSAIRTDNAGQGFQGFWRPTA